MMPSPKKMNAIINQITPQTVVGQDHGLSGLDELTSGRAATTNISECTCIGSVDLAADGIIFTPCEQSIHKRRRDTHL